MSEKTISLIDEVDALTSVDTLTATLLYLMSRYKISEEADIHHLIIQHLDLLENHPQANSPSYKNLGSRLKKFWQRQQTSEAVESSQNGESIGSPSAGDTLH
jgi:hypothetical protein